MVVNVGISIYSCKINQMTTIYFIQPWINLYYVKTPITNLHIYILERWTASYPK